MTRDHLSDDELIDLLYGLGDAGGHVAGCAECSGRFSALRKTRAEMVATPEISARLLAAQRQQILERLKRPLLNWRWASAAGIAVVAVVSILSRPAAVPSAVPAVSVEADSELFTDVYSMERDVEPRAAAPIRSLFQEASYEKEAQ